MYNCGNTDKPIYPTTEQPKPYTYVLKPDESVKEYVQEFKRICDIKHIVVCLARWSKLKTVTVVDEATLRKDSKGEKWAGVCWEWTDSNNNLVRADIQVLDNDGYGNKWSPESLEGLIYHELGHCLLDLEHEASPPDRPKMMNPALYDNQVYVDNWDKMVEEEFSIPNLALFEEYGISEEELILTAHPFY